MGNSLEVGTYVRSLLELQVRRMVRTEWMSHSEIVVT